MGKEFRCPFEVMGEREGRIHRVELSEVQSERFDALREAFERLHTDREIIAIRLMLPDSLQQSATNLLDLRDKILPYQAEVIAADLDDQLYPFLPHQAAHRAEFERLLSTDLFDERAAKLLCQEFGSQPPQTIGALASWLESIFARTKRPIRMKDEDRNVLLSFDRSSLLIHSEAPKTTFHIVKAPFYPQAFGRYSDRIEMVINRHLDVIRLSEETRRRIQRDANDVHLAHGVPIQYPDETVQPTGLWIPDELYGVVPL